ncbi:hypothetical protein SK128_024886 [Halocaridina rubra]|uniref:DRBM domain-containing protein n=1 Tax=Halocaridina rubra TaxID=373956 RepID=A0AAN8X020_HALRR
MEKHQGRASNRIFAEDTYLEKDVWTSLEVKVNGQEYKPAVAGPTKKLAKANAAAACLQSLGLFPKDVEHPITEGAT